MSTTDSEAVDEELRSGFRPGLQPPLLGGSDATPDAETSRRSRS
ncbi:hypothetical protein [Halolamina rubra]|nr:hypothetical protein [Halolamina rubra]